MQHITPTNGLILTQDTRLQAGVYHLPDGIRIGADGITVDGEGVLIVHDRPEGAGLHLAGHSGVTIRGLQISGFYHGVRAEHASDLTLEQITVRNTQEIAGIDTFLYLWKPIDEAYGGGILLHKVQNSVVRGCDVQHQMNGILLYDCANLLVEANNGSFNSGWGVYLSNTNDSTIQDNQLDFCNRVFRRPENGSIRVEADAAAMVLVKGSSRNRFFRNSCLCGGDGIFLCGYEHPGFITPCNDNLFEENDCRLSPNNAIESTFSGGNIYRNNDCSRSNYAFWMGYSYDNLLEGNTIEFSRWAGIAIEHGYGFTIRGNRIHKNGEGIRLFTRGGVVTDVYYPDQRVTHSMDIRENDIAENAIGIYAYTGDEAGDEYNHHIHIEANTFQRNQVGVQVRRVRDSLIIGNQFSGQVVAIFHNEDASDVTFGENDAPTNKPS